ncbi:TonB-dependent receptor [Shewanella marina]|uniref:TonB-dependent receptor n=1 Tax=Shewanella marina TaxID=487319 RepID=UPI0004702C46|nr:TonB-dependent receptor [Shewanella marina]
MVSVSKLALFVSSVLASPLAIGASDIANSETEQPMDMTMVVVGRSDTPILNMPSDVEVIDSAQIQASGATNLAQLLRGQSSIQVSDVNLGPVFSMRGFSASQAANNTLILIDGRRLNNIDIAAPSLGAIALNQIDRIEILSGSAGVLYGDQAVGGVINIITKHPEDTTAQIQLGGGSYNNYHGMADVGGKINDNWGYYLAGSYDRGDNYRRHNENKTGSVLGRLNYQDDKSQFHAEASYYDNNRNLPGSLTWQQYLDDPRQVNPFNVDDYSHEMTQAYRLGYQYNLNDIWALSADANYTDSTVNSINWGSPGRNHRTLFELSPKAVANYQVDAGTLNIISGVDLSRGTSKFSFGRENVQKVLSVYTQATVPLTSTVSYVVGGRYSEVRDNLVDGLVYSDGVELKQNAHAFELGLNYRPTDAWRFYVRANDNFRFAKVDEQAYTSPGVMGLTPQTGRSYETGFDWLLASQTIRLNLYRLDLEDEIIYDNNAQKPTGGSFDGANVNADASRRYGLDLDWDWQITQMVEVGASYQYVDAEFTKGPNDGKQLSWVAPHTGRVYTSVDITDSWQLYLDANYVGSHYSDGDNSNVGDKHGAPKLEAYTLANIALNYHRDNWLASLRVNNLLDKQYVSASYYGSYGNSYYAGAGREIDFTVSYQF